MRRPVTAALLCAVLTLAACGGDDALSEDEYRSEAAKICTESNKATQAIKPPTRATQDAISDYFRRLLAPNERATDRFAALAPPEKLKPAHDAVIAANRKGITLVEGVIKDVDAGKDPRAVLGAASGELRGLNRQAADAARRLGVPACADA